MALAANFILIESIDLRAMCTGADRDPMVVASLLKAPLSASRRLYTQVDTTMLAEVRPPVLQHAAGFQGI